MCVDEVSIWDGNRDSYRPHVVWPESVRIGWDEYSFLSNSWCIPPEDDGIKSLHTESIVFMTISSLQMIDKTVEDLEKKNKDPP